MCGSPDSTDELVYREFLPSIKGFRQDVDHTVRLEARKFGETVAVLKPLVSNKG
jgi:hypothetical protein